MVYFNFNGGKLYNFNDQTNRLDLNSQFQFESVAAILNHSLDNRGLIA